VLEALPSDSRLEVVMARLLGRAALPPATFHPTVHVAGRRLVPDCVFHAEKIMVEVDGFAFHGDRRAFERDRKRDSLAAAAGWVVLRFTWRQIVERPDEVVARLQAVLCLRRRKTARVEELVA
jgi:very-short-patch-repair endonuclease